MSACVMDPHEEEEGKNARARRNLAEGFPILLMRGNREQPLYCN